MLIKAIFEKIYKMYFSHTDQIFGQNPFKKCFYVIVFNQFLSVSALSTKAQKKNINPTNTYV